MSVSVQLERKRLGSGDGPQIWVQRFVGGADHFDGRAFLVGISWRWSRRKKQDCGKRKGCALARSQQRIIRCSASTGQPLSVYGQGRNWVSLLLGGKRPGQFF